MRRERAERRAAELQTTAEPGIMFFACHKGRNRWVVQKRLVKGDFYHSPEEVES